MHLAVRLVAAVVLVGLLLGLCVQYDSAYDENSPYPPTDELATNYDDYVGEETLLFGTVRDIEVAGNATPPNRATIEVDSSEGTFEMTVREFRGDVKPGGVVQVYGTLQSDRTIEATNVEVVNPAGSSNLYKYAVSAIGAILVVALFFRRWQFNADTLAFEVRDDG